MKKLFIAFATVCAICACGGNATSTETTTLSTDTIVAVDSVVSNVESDSIVADSVSVVENDTVAE